MTDTTTIKKIPFTKMQGAGNDYIYVNTLLYSVPDPEATAIKWSDRHFGIGSDGLVLIGAPKSKENDFSMRIFNADGSEAMMCGNASRCIGKYVYEYGLTDRKDIRLETLSGIKHLHLNTKEGRVESVTVEMGMPQNIRETDLCGIYPGKGIALSVGNPHLVIFVDDISTVRLEEIGPQLEHHPDFPDRVNVEFAQIQEDGHIRMRVWERGSGITMACGTGACATAVAAAFSGRCGRTSRITMDGGTLTIEWNEEDGQIRMTGPATRVFDGEIEIDE